MTAVNDVGRHDRRARQIAGMTVPPGTIHLKLFKQSLAALPGSGAMRYMLLPVEKVEFKDVDNDETLGTAVGELADFLCNRRARWITLPCRSHLDDGRMRVLIVFSHPRDLADYLYAFWDEEAAP